MGWRRRGLIDPSAIPGMPRLNSERSAAPRAPPAPDSPSAPGARRRRPAARRGHLRREAFEVRVREVPGARPQDQRGDAHLRGQLEHVEAPGPVEDRRLDLGRAGELHLSVGPIVQTLRQVEIEDARIPVGEELLAGPFLARRVAARPDGAALARALGERVPCARRGAPARAPAAAAARSDRPARAARRARAAAPRPSPAPCLRTSDRGPSAMRDAPCSRQQRVRDADRVAAEPFPVVGPGARRLGRIAVAARVHRNHMIVSGEGISRRAPRRRRRSRSRGAAARAARCRRNRASRSRRRSRAARSGRASRPPAWEAGVWRRREASATRPAVS